MSEELKLQRSREQWSGCDPRLMAQQSPAAIMYALQDAKRDITALYRHADNLRAELSRIKAGQGEAVAWQFQGRDGAWCLFANEKHKELTIKDGTWPVRALYTSPPSDPGAVPVRRELLERHLKKMSCHPGMLFTPVEGLLGTFDELRALLAQSEGVKL